VAHYFHQKNRCLLLLKFSNIKIHYLTEIKSDKIFISIPLRCGSPLPIEVNRHNGTGIKFEDWQLDWLLEKTGWKIIDRSKWTNPLKNLVSAH
jgi:hypothetical protein